MTGCTGYVTDWNFIAFFVILISFMAIGLLFGLSNFLPGATRSKLRGLLRSELMQAVLSIFIIVVLITVTSVACTVSVNGNDPFNVAETYVGNLITGQNGGLNLISGLYSYSVAYATISAIFSAAGDIIASFIQGLSGLIVQGNTFTIEPIFGYDFGVPYGALSSVYMDLFYPLTLMATGLQFVQYLAIVISQATAFAIILPVALIMRALVFLGGGIRNAANGVLAVAIAMYIIYPLTISLDIYALTWIGTQCTSSVQQPNCNPSAAYISFGSSVQVNSFLLSSGASIGSQTCVNLGGAAGGNRCGVNSGTFFGSAFSQALSLLNPAAAVATAYNLISDVSSYLFTALVMLAINLSITLAFAMGLTRALDSGIEGAASFWSTL